MHTIIAFVLAGLLIALPAAAQTTGGRDRTSAGGATNGTTVGVNPGGTRATRAASRSCETAGDCEVSLRGRYMRIVNSMARLACGDCIRRP